MMKTNITIPTIAMVTIMGFPRQIVTEHTTLDMATRFFKALTQFQNEIISAGMKGRFESTKPLIGWVAWLHHHYPPVN